MAQHTMTQAPQAPAAEGKDTRYLRQIRNAVVFLAILAALGLAGSIIAGIAIGVSAAHSGSSATSNCLSQGGTDSSC